MDPDAGLLPLVARLRGAWREGLRILVPTERHTDAAWCKDAPALHELFCQRSPARAG